MKAIRAYLSPHVVIIMVLLLANGVGWVLGAAASSLPEVAPIIHPGVDEIRRNWGSGDVVGETFSVTVTELEAAQTIAWFLAPRPEIPFSRPQVVFTPEGVEGRGIAAIAGLQVEVYGSGQVWVESGKPNFTVDDLGIGNAGVPAVVKETLQSQVATLQGLYDQLNLPIEITKIEIGDGVATVEGVYR